MFTASELQNSGKLADKHYIMDDVHRYVNILGNLSAYETLPVPSKYPGVYI